MMILKFSIFEASGKCWLLKVYHQGRGRSNWHRLIKNSCAKAVPSSPSVTPNLLPVVGFSSGIPSSWMIIIPILSTSRNPTASHHSIVYSITILLQALPFRNLT